MSYLDQLTPEQRAAMLAPSPALIALRAFAVRYRKDHPGASMNEIQQAYQLAGGSN
jgi:hypothetical protein